MSKRILLITGGSGYLGRHLIVKASQAFDVYATYNTHPAQIKAGHPLRLNLTDREAVLQLLTNLAPQVIIHTAAVNPGQGDHVMLSVNRDGAHHMAEGAVAVGARLIHISSDVVHDGQNAPYADDVPPSPIDVYGRSKAAGETVVAQIDPQATIVRTSLIYGLDEMDRGTASFIKRLEAGETLALFSDVLRQPIWVETLVTALLKLIDLDFAGILNLAGRQVLTREEFGRRMLHYWQVDPQGLLQSGRAADISDTIPLDLRLSIDKAEALFQMTFPGVDEVLAMQAY